MLLKLLGKDIHQSYHVVAMCIGIVIGMILAIVFRIGYFVTIWWAIFAFLLLFVAYLRPKVAFIVIALIAGMILAFFRAASELKGQDYIRQFYGQVVTVSGTVEGDPESDEKGTKLKLTSLKFGERGEFATSGNIYISISLNEEVARGDTVKMKGEMMDGFGTYAGYMYKPQLIMMRKPDPGDLTVKVRNWFAGVIKKLIPEPEVNLGLSYLLGMRADIPGDLDEKLRTVGLVHIVVASGAHLSILVDIARKIFGKLSRFAGLWFAVILVWLFMMMVGFTPSILRAGIMSMLTILAWYVGRKFAPWRIILIVAAITLMINPMYLINLGWQLSFASFGGIMIIDPRIVKFFYGKRKPGFVMSVVFTTVAATLMTLPVVLYYYGQISLISVVANLLILPTLPYAMGLVFLTGVCAGIPSVGTIFSFLATKLLDYHILVVDFFGERKEFLIQIDQHQPWVFLIYGVIFLFFGVSLFRKIKIRKIINDKIW